jgi:hypothetical protein
MIADMAQELHDTAMARVTARTAALVDQSAREIGYLRHGIDSDRRLIAGGDGCLAADYFGVGTMFFDEPFGSLAQQHGAMKHPLRST